MDTRIKGTTVLNNIFIKPNTELYNVLLIGFELCVFKGFGK